jgi:hypothetical protein
MRTQPTSKSHGSASEINFISAANLNKLIAVLTAIGWLPDTTPTVLRVEGAQTCFTLTKGVLCDTMERSYYTQ